MQDANTQEEMRQYYHNTITSVEKILGDLKERNEENDEELQGKVSSLISKVENNNEKLICTICSPGYYVDSDGKCVNFLNKLQIISNCESHV